MYSKLKMYIRDACLNLMKRNKYQIIEELAINQDNNFEFISSYLLEKKNTSNISFNLN